MPTTPDFTAHAAERVERFSTRLVHLLSFVPEERLAWSPAPDARSALRLVTHAALVNRFFAGLIGGDAPAAMPTPEEFFRTLHTDEHTVPTREGALAFLNETTAELRGAIAKVDAETIDSNPNSPFGALPMRFWLGEAGDHLAAHAAQLAYLQTTWGDLDDHMG